MRRVLAADGVLATLLAATVTYAAPSQASTATDVSPFPVNTCSVDTWNNSDGGAETSAATDLNVGPHDYCTTIRSLSEGTQVWFECGYQNDAGNLWVYVRLAGTQVHGWVWADHLDIKVGQSLGACPS